MMGQMPLAAEWEPHARVWAAFVASLRDLEVPLAEDMSFYLTPRGPQTWASPHAPESWRATAIAFLGSKPVNTGVSVDFYRDGVRLVLSGWGRDSANVEIRLRISTPDMLDEALGYTAALVGLLPDLENRCQPIGCDAGIHLPGCEFADLDGPRPEGAVGGYR